MKFFTFFSIILCWITICSFEIGSVKAIVGGRDAFAYEAGYHVSIQVNGHHVCGGAIVSDFHILTAASCFIQENEHFFNRVYTIVGGTINLANRNDPYRVEMEVKSIYIPKQFKRTNIQAESMNTLDVAILKLSSSLETRHSPALSIVNLPDKSTNEKSTKYMHKLALVSGFGINNLRARENYYASVVDKECTNGCNKLRVATSTILHKRMCQNLLHKNIDVKHMCANVVQSPAEENGMCDGDLGAPLVMVKENIVIGVLSKLQNNCDEHYHPAVYSRITHLIDFIEQAMRDEVYENIRVGIYSSNTVTATDGSNQVTRDLIEFYKFL